MKSVRFGIILCILLVVGCAIPLQRGPDPVQEQSQAESAEGQSRNLAVESSDADAVANDAADEDAATSAGAESAQPQAATTLVQESAVEQEAAESTDDAGSTVAASGVDYSFAGSAGELLDLAALDQTFLETIDAANDELGQINGHRFVEVSDERGIVWQGEALIGEGQAVLLMQPMQFGGQIAVRLPLEATVAIDTPEFEAALAQILATVDIELPAPDSFGPPDAEIQFVRARETSVGVWSFDVRLNHPDTGWEDYTDGWHVETLDGQILGVRILLHPHVNEMPFTRGQGGISIPGDVTEVQVRSHDLVSGYGLETVIVPIGESGSGDKYEVSR